MKRALQMSDEELIGIVTQHKGGRAFHSHYELKIFQIVSQILNSRGYIVKIDESGIAVQK
jgi:hypothetical protein